MRSQRTPHPQCYPKPLCRCLKRMRWRPPPTPNYWVAQWVVNNALFVSLVGVELERGPRTRARREVRAGRAWRAHAGCAALGVGAARAAAASAAPAAALALVLQVVWGARAERPPLPAVDALARRVDVVRLARLAGGGARRHAPEPAARALPLLPAHRALPARRRPGLPLTRP